MRQQSPPLLLRQARIRRPSAQTLPHRTRRRAAPPAGRAKARAQFTLDDFLQVKKQIARLGGISKLVSALPGGDRAMASGKVDTGALVQWMRDELGIIATASESEDLARTVESSDGVYVVPWGHSHKIHLQTSPYPFQIP